MSSPGGSVVASIAEVASRRPLVCALRVDRGARLTFGSLERRSNRLARGLVELGVSPGDPVALACCDRHAGDLLVGYTAAHKAGATATVLPIEAGPAVVAAVLRAAGPRVVLGCPEGVDVWRATGVPARVVGDDPDVLWWRSLEARQSPDPVVGTCAPGTMAELQPVRSGDGSVELVPVTHGELDAVAVLPGAPAGSAVLHAVPLATSLGLHSLTLGALRAGITVVLQAPFDPVRYYRLLAELSDAYLLPSQVERLAGGTHWITVAGGLCSWTPAEPHPEGGFGLLLAAAN